MSLSREEKHVLECIKSLESQGIPVVPLAVGIRAGMSADQAGAILESLKRKNILGDVNR